MGFVGVYRAIFDYVPQAEGELQINAGDILYILEKNTDEDWWRAKKKASGAEEDEPEGLIPNNYVEEAQPLEKARALYEYTRQTDEELSFPEDAALDVFDTTDPDWILVGLDGDYGFVPANYIEVQHSDSDQGGSSSEAATAPPTLPVRPSTTEFSSPMQSPSRAKSIARGSDIPAANPAGALANVMAGRANLRESSSPVSPQSNNQENSEVSDEEPVTSPALPARPRAQSAIGSEPVARRSPEPLSHTQPHLTPGGFHMYNISEMVSVMGKRKKMPTTLGINLGTGTILIAPEKTQDGPTQEWTAEKMTHYSREGKHVFLEFVRPSKSVDFHAGAKDTAEEIVSALGELAGAAKAEGLREVIMAGSGQHQRRGHILYDFMAQGDDEVTVAVGDEVVILDDSKSEEWWQVRRLKNGREGVVPSSYIEIIDTPTPPPAPNGPRAARSTVEQNRLDEIRLTKEAVKAAKGRDHVPSQVGPGMPLPERGSSLTTQDHGNDIAQQRSKRDNSRVEGSGPAKASKSKPDREKVRTWTDRSKSFSVEAQYLGLKDGKINLHKVNGVKIAVPLSKMSMEDIEYIERLTGTSLDGHSSSDASKRQKATNEPSRVNNAAQSQAGATVEQSRTSDYDWFQFFLSCDVAVGLCERYTQAFIKDSMDESVLPDIDASVLRNLGLREGDIIKVMRNLDARYGRTAKAKRDNGDGGAGDDMSTGRLFSGPGGTLRNNTRKGRPAPAVMTSDVVDGKALSPEAFKSEVAQDRSRGSGSDANSKPNGFDDDAWDLKPTKQQSPPRSNAQMQRAGDLNTGLTSLAGPMQELSLLSEPLEPTKAIQPSGLTNLANPPAAAPVGAQQPSQAQQPGATPSLFSSIAAQAGPPESAVAHPAGIVSGPLGNSQVARTRPTVPHLGAGAASLMPPPPARPLSAPQATQPSVFGPPTGPVMPQMTGVHPNLQGQPAPPGQSLNDINQAHMQQQYSLHLQPQPTGMMPYGLQTPSQSVMSLNTGMPAHPGFSQPMLTGMQGAPSPFADPARSQLYPHPSHLQSHQTGFPGQLGAVQTFSHAPVGGINSVLSPPLVPERTGVPSQFQSQFQTPVSYAQPSGSESLTAAAQHHAVQPLLPQQTGPAPAVRFGVTGDARKLTPQPTGRRANLAQATPLNPFGF